MSETIASNSSHLLSNIDVMIAEQPNIAGMCWCRCGWGWMWGLSIGWGVWVCMGGGGVGEPVTHANQVTTLCSRRLNWDFAGFVKIVLTATLSGPGVKTIDILTTSIGIGDQSQSFFTKTRSTKSGWSPLQHVKRLILVKLANLVNEVIIAKQGSLTHLARLLLIYYL